MNQFEDSKEEKVAPQYFNNKNNNMKCKTKMLVIAKDDYPLERIMGKPIVNFFRYLIHASHTECHKCYEVRKGIKVKSN